MLLSAINPHNSLLAHLVNSNAAPNFFYNSYKLPHCFKDRCGLLTVASSSSSSFSLQNPNPNSYGIHYVANNEYQEPAIVTSASAVASAIRRASNSPVEFMQRIEKDRKSGLVLPSSDFQRLCVEQLDLFRRIVDPHVILSVYVRPAGSYVMDRLELRRVTAYPGVVNAADIVILVGSFSIPTGLRTAEVALSNQQVEFVPECRAVVFPMVKHPFVVGFLAAEFERLETPMHESDFIHSSTPEEAYSLPLKSDLKQWDAHTFKSNDSSARITAFTAEQRLNAVNISRSLAMAYVMDQKAVLLQESSWKNSVRMSNLVEQIRGPLSSIRTLSKMLSIHTKRSEISHDIVEDILVQGDHIRDILQQLQDVVYLTKANLVHYNQERLKKTVDSAFAYPESLRPPRSRNLPSDGLSTKFQSPSEQLSLYKAAKDIEMPMPPPALAPLQQHGIRPCNVSDVLVDLVEAVSPLAQKQRRVIKLSEIAQSLQAAIEEPPLHQALSNLIEGALLRTRVGGMVEIMSMRAPAGGALVVIDDDGPDMHYMTRMHSLTPFGDLCSDDMVEDNMTWNFIAGLSIAREILEHYGCVVHVISPRRKDAALGAGGTRVELWLPSFTALPDFDGPSQLL